MDELQKIFMGSEKAKLLEELAKELQDNNKAVVILINDHEDNSYSCQVMLLGLDHTYEVYGILEVGKQQMQSEDY